MLVQTERLLSLYRTLIQIPSVVGDEHEIAQFLAEELENIGLETRIHRYGAENRPNLIARLRGDEPGPRLLLSGHLDTVPVHNGWNTDPFQPVEKDDRVYGLAACDMKGGLAAMVEAVRIFSQPKRSLKGEVILAFSSDEEGSSEGTYAMLREGLVQADMAIVGECRFNPMMLGFRGRYSMDIAVEGQVAHASRYPQEGENALISAARLAVELERLPVGEHPEMGKGSPCLRRLSGGEPTVLKVPDHAEMMYERYVVPGETQESVWQQVEELVDRLGLTDKVSLAWSKRKGPFLEGFATDESELIVQLASQVFAEVTGQSPRYGYDPSVCDANYIAQMLKIPVLTFGPSGANWHAPNEYGLKSEVIAASRVYLGIMEELQRI